MQQLFAKSVDRLDFQPARRLHGAREEAAREVKRVAIRSAGARLLDFFRQRRIVE